MASSHWLFIASMNFMFLGQVAINTEPWTLSKVLTGPINLNNNKICCLSLSKLVIVKKGYIMFKKCVTNDCTFVLIYQQDKSLQTLEDKKIGMDLHYTTRISELTLLNHCLVNFSR
jgi:hypothetical protein